MTTTTNSSIGGTLDTGALEALTRTPDPDRLRMQHFNQLDRRGQASAIHRMAADGFSDAQIASATQLSIEFIRRVLTEAT